MAIERDTDDAVTPAPAGRRYSHKQVPMITTGFDPMVEEYRATLEGRENGKLAHVRGAFCPTEAEATASAWEALRVWALAGRVPV
jgi:hypothetical protein